MLGYQINDGERKLWEPHRGPMPDELREKLLDPDTLKLAWNVPFEYAVFKYVLKMLIPLEQWRDIMAWARHLSLPGKLEKAGPAIGLLPGELKDEAGKKLIHQFCQPYHKGGELTLFGISEPQYHNHEDSPRDWEAFGSYCKQDVATEAAIYEVTSNIPLPETETRLWWLDQKINEAGIPVNRGFVEKALALALASKKRLEKKLQEMTGLKNPNSRPQFLPWAQNLGYPFLSIGKNFVTQVLQPDSGINPTLRKALELRREASKTSYTKFENILNILSDDNRLRHQFAFLGAARSGRWAGRDAQVQNMARPSKEVEKNYDLAISYIENCPSTDWKQIPDSYLDEIEKKFTSVIGMVVSCLRSVFQAPDGKQLVVCDLSSIENRVLGWLANCDAIAQVFREGRDAYLDFAARMYGVPYESLIKIDEHGNHKAKDKDASEKRQVAKPAVLGAGYGLGPGAVRKCAVCQKEVKPRFEYCSEHPNATFVYEAIITEDQYGNKVKTGLMGYAENMGVKLTPEQAYLAWQTFRKSYPEVVELWAKYEQAAIKVLDTGKAVRVGQVIFQRRKRKNGQFILRIILPSGRGLHYINARVETEVKQSESGKEYERSKLMYDGIGHGVGKIGKGQVWGPVYTYGGKLTENIDQAISRDLLANSMMLVDEAQAEIVMHVHDEIVVLGDKDPFSFGLADLKRIMETNPDWAPGLELGAEGWVGKVYRK